LSLFQSVAARASQSGKVFASGKLIPADEDVDVVTGLTAVEHCFVSLVAQPAATHTISVASPSSTAGSIQIRSYKPTSGSDPTPTAATGTMKSVAWWAVGT
jgi:hypothetical protein